MLDKQFIEKAHLFTHAGCMDGSASAILFMHAGGLKENIHYVNAGRVEAALEDWPLLNDARVPMLIVDLCPATDKMAEFLAWRQQVVIIDHHSTAEKYANRNNFRISVGNKACGCEGFRQWLAEIDPKFNEPHYARMTRVVDDHDRWLKNIPFSSEMPVLFSLIGQKDFVDRFMNVADRFGSEKPDYWNDFERDLVRLMNRVQDQRFKGIMQKFQKRTRKLGSKQFTIGYVIDGEVNNSELLNRYLIANPDVDVACQINFELQKVAFRSLKGGFDVAQLAKAYGGGGHSSASGHPLPDGLIKRIIEGMHSEQLS